MNHSNPDRRLGEKVSIAGHKHAKEASGRSVANLRDLVETPSSGAS